MCEGFFCLPTATPCHYWAGVVMLQRCLTTQLGVVQQAPDLPDYAKPIFTALIAILSGSRDPSLADNPDLYYDDAAEVLLLLEQLAAHEA